MLKIIDSTELDMERVKTKTAAATEVTATVAAILEDVKNRGDEALREYTSRFDGCDIAEFELSRSAMDNAIKTVDPEFIKVMERAAANIESYHLNQVSTGFDLLPKKGIILGQKITPIAQVGCYIPGGTAPYPSSVLMNCIPAKIAGVKEIVILTPPSSAPDTAIADSRTRECNGVDARILAAAEIAGVDRVFTVGGAQAIAALAYGTQTIPRVNKITGPGNMYVSEAKRQVYGIVGIDMLAGPSDILIVADKHTNPKIIAADMLSQCEHGADSKAVLVTDSLRLAKKVQAEIKVQIQTLPRKDIAAKALKDNSMIVVAPTIDEVFTIVNKLAPEHLEVLLDEPFNYLSRIVNAGSVFLGTYTAETFGDYLAGPNHVIPTNGTAHFSSPLTVDDFIKKTSYTYFMKEALMTNYADAIRFAKEERLEAHARAVEERLKELGINL